MKKFLIIALIAVVSFAFAEEKSNSIKLTVNGMTCASCVSTVEKALKGVSGVSDAKVDLKSKSATVMFAANSKVSADVLVKAVADAGFTASESKTEGKATSKSMKKADDCDGGCCGDDCDSNEKDMKTKKSKAKKS